MLESGLRLDEVTGLQLDDVHIKEMYLKVRGKGDEEGYVPIGSTTEKALSRYAAHFRISADLMAKAFFLNIYGEPLGYEAVKLAFDRLAKRSGIRWLHPHLLCHTAATRLFANGADGHTVQRMLRHPNDAALPAPRTGPTARKDADVLAARRYRRPPPPHGSHTTTEGEEPLRRAERPVIRGRTALLALT